MLKNLVIILFLFNVTIGFSQSKCDQVLLTGRVEDSLNPQSFYNLMIVNRTRGKGVFGQPNGHFSVYTNEGDSISISIKGYPMIGFRISADENCQFKYHKFIELKATEMKEVVIKPLKTLNQIKEERQELSMRETRQVTGVEMLQSPITALYQTFSKKEKNKKWIAEQEFKDNERKVVQELLRLYVAYDIIKLTEDEFDEFIIFLNINETFLKTATEMELITFVQDKFEHFKRLHSIAIEENYIWKSELEKNNKKQALIDLLKLFVAHELINLPEVEFDRFIDFMKMEDSFLKVASETELINFVQDKYSKYIAFYKLNFDTLNLDYQITDIDNYKWKSDLNCNNKKEAITQLLKMYIEHHVIDLESSEFDRFIRFMNLDELFMKSSTDSELISFVQEKYKKYLQFYKIK